MPRPRFVGERVLGDVCCGGLSFLCMRACVSGWARNSAFPRVPCIPCVLCVLGRASMLLLLVMTDWCRDVLRYLNSNVLNGTMPPSLGNISTSGLRMCAAHRAIHV